MKYFYKGWEEEGQLRTSSLVNCWGFTQWFSNYVPGNSRVLLKAIRGFSLRRTVRVDKLLPYIVHPEGSVGSDLSWW